ncbi:MAG: 2-hydroxychromene-2-carboxylate isomerase [Thermodesulfobacteriota bacterium]
MNNVPLNFQFWYDLASPYSYISVMRIESLCSVAGVEAEWKPFLLGPIFKRQGWDTSPFNIYGAKGRYMWRDIERLSAKYGIPFRKPSGFPRNGVLASRVAIASESQVWRRSFSKLVFTANFAEDRDISDEAVISSILGSLGEEPARVIRSALSDENKGKLRESTEEAVALGIFGAPSFVSGDEVFWGNDRLEDAIEWQRSLGEESR